MCAQKISHENQNKNGSFSRWNLVLEWESERILLFSPFSQHFHPDGIIWFPILNLNHPLWNYLSAWTQVLPDYHASITSLLVLFMASQYLNLKGKPMENKESLGWFNLNDNNLLCMWRKSPLYSFLSIDNSHQKEVTKTIMKATSRIEPDRYQRQLLALVSCQYKVVVPGIQDAFTILLSSFYQWFQDGDFSSFFSLKYLSTILILVERL